MKAYPLLILVLLVGSAAACAGEQSPAPRSLAELAEKAEFIALAQVRDTDYLRRRELPVSGSAYLRVLIPYKGDRDVDLVEVYERGLHEHECYFPNPTVFEEGRRYLLFLRRDPEQPERYRGLPEGCAADVLVDRDNHYAVRLPVTGIALSDDLEAVARPMQFSDPYAVVDDASLPPALRKRMLDAGYIEAYEDDGAGSDAASEGLPQPVVAPDRLWRYTRGVALDQFRELMRLE